MKTFGWGIPDFVIKAIEYYDLVDKFWDRLFNLTFKIEIGAVVGMKAKTLDWINTLRVNADTDIPGYRWNDMTFLDKSIC